MKVFEVDFRVSELLEPPDLQASIFVGNDLYDHDRFARLIRPEASLRLIGELCGRHRVKNQWYLVQTFGEIRT